MQISWASTEVQRIAVESIPHRVCIETQESAKAQMTDYEIVLDVAQAICLPDNSTRYKIGMKVTNEMFITDEATNDLTKGAYNFWYLGLKNRKAHLTALRVN